MLRRFAFALSLPLALAASPAQAEQVPFVGCAGDGQTGTRAAPRAGMTPNVPAAVARRLAYYRSAELGVLAPRGWRCLGLHGSNGAILIVAPRLPAASPFSSEYRLHGHGVVVTLNHGGTSGRFAVARAIFQLFPAYRGFALRVAEEGIADDLQLPLSPHDRVSRRSSTAVDYASPARRVGLGTRGLLAPGTEPVIGSAILLPGDEPDLVQLDMRLGSGTAADRSAIRSHFHAARGAPLRVFR